MTSFIKVPKGLLVAVTLLTATAGVSAQASAEPNPELVNRLQQAFTAQVSKMSVEMTRQLDASIRASLAELGVAGTLESEQHATTMSIDAVETANSQTVKSEDNK